MLPKCCNVRDVFAERNNMQLGTNCCAGSATLPCRNEFCRWNRNWVSSKSYLERVDDAEAGKDSAQLSRRRHVLRGDHRAQPEHQRELQQVRRRHPPPQLLRAARS